MRRCATMLRVLATASSSPMRGLRSPSPRERAWWPHAGTRLPGGQPPRDAHSPRAAFRGGQLPNRGRPGQVAAGASHPRRAPLRGAVAGDRHGGARGGGQTQVRVPPQAWPSVEDVRLGYRGAEGLKVGAGGELLVRTSLGVLKDAAPVSYQRIRGERIPVESRYVLKGMVATGLRWELRCSLPAGHRPWARLLHLPRRRRMMIGLGHRGGRRGQCLRHGVHRLRRLPHHPRRLRHHLQRRRQ